MDIRRTCKGWYSIFDGPWSHSRHLGRVKKTDDGKWKATGPTDRIVGYAKTRIAAAALLA